MTEPLSGAQFQREVGADPERWAAAFLAAYAKAEGVRTDADRRAFVAAWFRDAMDAAVKKARDIAVQMLSEMKVVHHEIAPLKPVENTALQDTLAGLRGALAAQERGEDQAVLETLRFQVKRLSRIASE